MLFSLHFHREGEKVTVSIGKALQLYYCPTRGLQIQPLPAQAGLNQAERSDVSEIPDLHSVSHTPHYIVFLVTL